MVWPAENRSTDGLNLRSRSAILLLLPDVFYLATAIGTGSLVGSWMNDSGFWIFAKMGGLTEAEALKTWTPLLAVLGIVSMAVTLLLANLMP